MIFPNITNDPEQKQQIMSQTTMESLPRPIGRPQIGYAAKCIDDAVTLISISNMAVEFWRTLRDILGLVRLKLMEIAGRTLLLCEGRNEVLLSEITPFHGGLNQLELSINARSLKASHSRFERRLHNAMCEYKVKLITVRCDERGVIIILDKQNERPSWSDQFSVARVGFDDLTIDNIIAATYETTYSEIRDVLSFAAYACRLGGKRNAQAQPRFLTAAFDTDENPCEVGFESF